MTEGPRASPCSHHPARAPAFRPRLVTDLPAIWAVPADEIARRLDTSAEGLTSREAAARLAGYGPNELSSEGGRSRIGILLGQLKSPLLLILVFAAAVSGWSGEWADSTIVILILIASAGIGYLRESRAESAITALRSRILLRAQVRRDGQDLSVPFREVVPGDVVLLSAGSLVPADGVLLDATDCFVNEAVLTGESFPAEKRPGAVLAAATPAPGRVNCAFMGTSVRSGFARLLVVKTGRATQFGDIAERLATRAPETEFDRGLRHFGYVLLVAMLVLVLAVFAANVLLGRPAVETLLFSIALAVGLSPELLPAILSVNLARGARAMADRGVLVRRLTAIENLGSMDILCTDKTGTLTEGVVQLEGAYDEDGRPSPRVLEMAACNAALQTGLANPLDEAILAARPFADPETQKLAEIPYDFVRKRLSVVVRGPAGESLVTKGAFASILGACTRTASGALLDAAGREALMLRFQEWAARGIRVLGVASRRLQGGPYGHDQERDLSFEGFLTFLDRPKTGVGAALSDLARLGVAVKVITGDSMLVAQHLAEAVGLGRGRVLTGVELDALHDEGLWQRAEATDVFAEVDPNQKERIIRALKKTGHVVGFLGDGVNDAPAMHAADTSLSVDQAADVAKEAADFVLLERDLDVIRGGVEEGRKTFANTLKYILTTTSANLGNMVSMAVASLALPFLPLLAGQVLLNNFLSDVPAMGIADDGVDPEIVARPRRWDMRMIGHFMVEFGLLSSAFDFLTFAVLLTAFVAPVDLFRTAWFVESLLTELLIALVVRTRRPFYRSRPGKLLAVSTLAVAAAALAIPYLPGARVLGFAPLPASLVGAVLLITAFYVAATDRMKRSFFRRFA
jgi:Mg2+-importing ATPase